MIQKSMTLTPNAAMFLTDDLKSKLMNNLPMSPEEEDMANKIYEFLGVKKPTDVVELTTNIEVFLLALFLSLPAPSSPLRLRSHQRMIDDVSKILEKTLDTDALPDLPIRYVEMVRNLVDNDEKFAELDIPFEFKKGEEVFSLPLKATNVLNSIGFLDCIEQVFAYPEEAGE